ncbi:MAG: hypothetical protein MUO23_06265 [Anaerolineales bacterium]|nr:hypothetical protein [Anaerolineales bacterium]
MPRRRTPVILLASALLVLAVLTAFGPAERSLGSNVRLVYLHGAWVWAALLGLGAAAACGGIALVTRRVAWQAWSRALGLAGTAFWVTYLPISLLTMQMNWNGLFLQEPRWRLGLHFAVAAIVLQIGWKLLDRPTWTSGGNLLFFMALTLALVGAEQVLHPPAPIAASGSAAIQGFFLAMLAVALIAEWLLARWLRAVRA